MVPKWRTIFFTSSIIRYNNDKNLFNVLPSISESLLNILILDSSAVVVNSAISYKDNTLAFLAAAVISKSLSYLILCSRCCSILYSQSWILSDIGFIFSFVLISDQSNGVSTLIRFFDNISKILRNSDFAVEAIRLTHFFYLLKN